MEYSLVETKKNKRANPLKDLKGVYKKFDCAIGMLERLLANSGKKS